MTNPFKKFARRLVGEKYMGMLEYYRFPERRDVWGGPLNGQQFRKQIFEEIVATLNPNFIIETGTYIGVTTEFFARSIAGPVHTVEASARNHGFATARFRGFSNIRSFLGDSRSFLLDRLSKPEFSQNHGFFYLDAHWHEDLPLKEELQIIFSRNLQSIVMIDDFKVPDDDGYRYDDYGESGALTLDYIAEVMSDYALSAFFPTCKAENETGSRRGSVVLASGDTADALSNLKSLRPW